MSKSTMLEVPTSNRLLLEEDLQRSANRPVPITIIRITTGLLQGLVGSHTKSIRGKIRKIRRLIKLSADRTVRPASILLLPIAPTYSSRLNLPLL